MGPPTVSRRLVAVRPIFRRRRCGASFVALLVAALNQRRPGTRPAAGRPCRTLPALSAIVLVACGTVRAEPCALPLRGPQDRVLSLSGEWAFELDPRKAGIAENRFARSLADRIRLPGTLDERGKRPLNEERCTGRLTMPQDKEPA